MKAKQTAQWLKQDDVIAAILSKEFPRSKWVSTYQTYDTCFEFRSERFAAASLKHAQKALMNDGFCDSGVFDFFREAKTRWVPRLRFRRFHHLDSDGVRNGDRERLAFVRLSLSTHKHVLECCLDRAAMKAFIQAQDMVLVWYLRVWRCSERHSNELGFPIGSKIENRDREPTYAFRFFVDDGTRCGRDRIATMTNFFGKRIVTI